MPDSYGNYHADLRDSAIDYRNWGWSVIPIRGDSDLKNPKAAAIAWAQFQQRQPTIAEIESWFDAQQFSGLGIVCGPISGLIVLDFDDADCATAFARACPDLTRTYTVISGQRGLPHYYYHVDANLNVTTRHTPGADLQAAGTYVIAAPTTIANQTWNNSYGSEPLKLTMADIERIHVFLDAYHYVAPSVRDQAEMLPLATSAVELAEQYMALARRIGRNNALFRIGSLARDSGWTLTAAIEALLNCHVVQPPNGSHPAETPEQRRQEGQRTLVSAFRYAPRPCLQTQPPKPGLPNAIRESLLQNGKVGVARLLDGLLLAGIDAKTWFTERIACEAVRIYGIGRRTVQAALKALQSLAQESPRNPPKKQDANAAKEQNKRRKQCSFVTGANRVKTGGRPAQQFKMPTNGQLYRWLGVRPSGSDRLDAAALQSPAAYRRALQRALIGRRPGQYSRQWLAGRLGVSVWTSRRYDRDIGITVAPRYSEGHIHWSNLDRLPLQVGISQPNGIFIQTADGRCYPPVRSIATRLLRQQHTLLLKRRQWNYYKIYYGNEQVLPIESGVSGRLSISEEIHKHAVRRNSIGQTYSVPIEKPHTTTAALNQHNQALAMDAESTESPEPEKCLWVCSNCMKSHLTTVHPGACDNCQTTNWETVPAVIWQDVERCKRWWRNRYQQHRANLAPSRESVTLLNERQLRLADRLYEQVRQRTPDRAITRRLARQLVRERGSGAVEKALQLLGERQTIYNAAGFILTVLGNVSAQAATATTTDHAAWVERLQQSPYAQFYANANQFMDSVS